LSTLKFNPLNRITACQLAALSFFLVGEADFSFLAAAELGAARAAPAVDAAPQVEVVADAAEVERACFGEAGPAAVAPEAVLVVDASEGAALAVDALAVELVADAAAAVEPQLACSVPVEALAVGASVVELAVDAVAGVVLGRACSVAASAAGALAVELVADAAEAVGPVRACSVAEVLAADELVAGLAAAAALVWPQADSLAAGCDWAQRSAQASAAWRAVDYDSVGHFAARHWACLRSAAGLGWVAGRN